MSKHSELTDSVYTLVLVFFCFSFAVGAPSPPPPPLPLSPSSTSMLRIEDGHHSLLSLGQKKYAILLTVQIKLISRHRVPHGCSAVCKRAGNGRWGGGRERINYGYQMLIARPTQPSAPGPPRLTLTFLSPLRNLQLGRVQVALHQK